MAVARIWNAVSAEFAKTSASRLVAIAWIGGLIGVLIRSAVFGDYIVDGQGRPVPGEFLAIWSAGQLMTSGHAAAAYDFRVLHQLQIADAGHPFSGYFMWLFPPVFLIVAALLASLPFAAAFVGWAVITLITYQACIDRLFRNRAAAIAYGLSPAAFLNVIVAQNGLLTAALFGGVLLTLRKNPLVSGLLLAALVVKPQLGLLFPVALVAGGHWRTIATAFFVTGIWLFVWNLVDPATIASFVHSWLAARNELLALGHQGWYKLQSIYGLSRTIGLDDGWASAIGVMSAVVLSAIVFLAWRSAMSFPAKAATLALCSLGATPYIYFYDFPLLTIAIGFLWRDATFDDFERIVAITAYLIIVLGIVSGMPFGIFAVCLIAMLVARRTARSGVNVEVRSNPTQ